VLPLIETKKNAGAKHERDPVKQAHMEWEQKKKEIGEATGTG